MSLQTFLEPSHLLPTIVLALSIFNCTTFFWLALTVWLNGARRAWITRLGVVGLGFSALFFFIHSLLVSSPLSQSAGLVSPDFLWRLIWLPAIAVPYIWFAIGLHYAALINQGWRRRRPALLIFSAILGCSVLALLLLYGSIFTFSGTLQLLAYGNLPPGSSWAPALLILFLFYVTFCATGPWFTPARVIRLVRTCWLEMGKKLRRQVNGHNHGDEIHDPTMRQALVKAFWDDPTKVELLEEPQLSWHLARPGLLLAAILMAALTTLLGVLGIWSLTHWVEVRQRVVAALPLNTIPLNLLALDMLANGAVALIILLIGYSVVRHGILIERPLARRGFFEQWRGIVIVATAVSILIALLIALTHSHLGSLLLITLLATGAYALFTWNSYTAHDRYIALLGPFLRSTNVRHWLNMDLQKTEQGLEDLFFHLCKDVLAVKCAHLTIMAGSIRRSFSYRWPAGAQFIAPSSGSMSPPASTSMPEPTPAPAPEKKHHAAARIRITVDGQPMICWVLPIYDELGLVAILYLGPREDGAAFTDEDMELAHACGQRILDTLSDHEAMQAVAGLLRRRTINVKLLDAQHRRILHDDILPQMHLALLRLETLRYFLANSTGDGSGQPEGENSTPPEELLDEAVSEISDAHRRLAAMMRATAPSAPHHLEHDGLMNAIRAMLEQDFLNAFDEIEWEVPEEVAHCIDEVTPPAIAELIFAAVQEALRNAARHARGTDIHRHLRVSLKASCSYPASGLEVIVSDDGVGIVSPSSATSGTGGGLLTHSALLAIAGGSLAVKSAPGKGVTVRILLPAEALR